jgi:hypothetical protein
MELSFGGEFARERWVFCGPFTSLLKRVVVLRRLTSMTAALRRSVNRVF